MSMSKMKNAMGRFAFLLAATAALLGCEGIQEQRSAADGLGPKDDRADPCAVVIPIASVNGDALWSMGVTTQQMPDSAILEAEWRDPGTRWAGFGNSLGKGYLPRDLSRAVEKNCRLVFQLEGDGIEKVHLKVKTYSEESETIPLVGVYDGMTLTVSIPIQKLDRPGFDWKNVREVVFGTWKRTGPVKIRVTFPLTLAADPNALPPQAPGAQPQPQDECPLMFDFQTVTSLWSDGGLERYKGRVTVRIRYDSPIEYLDRWSFALKIENQRIFDGPWTAKVLQQGSDKIVFGAPDGQPTLRKDSFVVVEYLAECAHCSYPTSADFSCNR